MDRFVPTVRVFDDPYHEAVSRVDHDSAALEFVSEQDGGPLWRLSYMEPDGIGIRTFDVAAERTEEHRAVAAAGEHLRRVYRGE